MYNCMDWDELTQRLDELKEIRGKLEDLVEQAEALGVTVEVEDYELHREILDLEEQLGDLKEADNRALCRAYERMAC